MDMTAYVEELRFRLSGNLVDLELNDEALVACVNSAFRTIQRFIDTTRLATIPAKSCIDLTNSGVSSVSRVFRTEGYMSGDGSINSSSSYDPMYMASWQMMSNAGGTAMNTMNNWIQNYAAYNTAAQIRSTISTELIFRFDKDKNLLYINFAFEKPAYVTIEYVPEYQDVSEIKSDFWIDMLSKLSLAIGKQVVGRIRKKFTQTNALWTLDTDILQEGIEEENALRERMINASQLTYGID